MNPRDLRIVFMGTPEFASYALKTLHEEGYKVVGVVTAPDKPAGRGLKLIPSAVKKYALEKGLRVLQPEKLKSSAFLEELSAMKADVQVVVAFRMLPEVVWSMPPMGTFNLHASLLPQYRGAAPINWAIINGEKETGATTFLLNHEIDTGKILLQEKIPVFKNETAGQLHDRIMVLGAGLILKTLDGLAEGKLEPKAQSVTELAGEQLKKAPKIFKEDCIIDWKRSCQDVVNFIHGMSPYPGAYTVFTANEAESSLKIFEAEALMQEHRYNYGEIFTDGKTTLLFSTPDGFVSVKSLQAAGKKRMSTADFLRGFRSEGLQKLPQ